MLRKTFKSRCTSNPHPLPLNINPKTLENIINITHLSLKEVKWLYKSFRSLAFNGFIEFLKFKESLGMLGRCENTKIPERMFHAFDANNDNKLDFYEYAVALGTMMKGTEDEKLELSFKILTSDTSIHDSDDNPYNRNIYMYSSPISYLDSPQNIERLEKPSNRKKEKEISLEDFKVIVYEVHITRVALSGAMTEHVNDIYVENLFNDLASFNTEGEPKMSLNDFKKAAKSSPEFLSLLGIFPKDLYFDTPIKTHQQITPFKNKTFSKDDSEKYGSVNNNSSSQLKKEFQTMKNELKNQIGSKIDDIKAEFLKIADFISQDFEQNKNNLSQLKNEEKKIKLNKTELTPIIDLPKQSNDDTFNIESRLKDLNFLSTTSYQKVSEHNNPINNKFNLYHPLTNSLTTQDALNTDSKSISNLNFIELNSSTLQLTNSISQKLESLSELLNSFNFQEQENEVDLINLRQKSLSSANLNHNYNNKELEMKHGLNSQFKFLISNSLSGVSYNNSDVISEKALSFSNDFSENPPMHINRFSSLIQTPNINRSQFKSIQLMTRIGKRSVKRISQLNYSKGFQGLAVHFGHQSWNIVLNMMIGIRMAAARANSETLRTVELFDFKLKEKFSILPRSRGLLDLEDEHKLEVMRFIDYAPMVFRQLRKEFNISYEEYINSVGPEQFLGNLILGNLSSLSELISEGKSGALFYYTSDGRFMLKTITKTTALSLRKWLPKYYKHCMANPETLLTRYYGFHSIRLKSQFKPRTINTKNFMRDKIYFVVMENFFHSPVEIHRRYDLKGSRIGRSVPIEKRSDKAIALKDLDILNNKDKICVGPEKKKKLMDQLTKDCDLLKGHGLMDYSLLLGVHETNFSNLFLKESISNDAVLAKPNTFIPFHRLEHGGILSQDKTKLYCVGVIDILTMWNTNKKLEFIFKLLSFNNTKEISCVNPTTYCARFLNFIDKLIE